MRKKIYLKISGVVLVLGVIGLMGVMTSSILAEDLAPLIMEKKYSPKIESILGMLVEKYLEDKVAAQSFAQERKIPFQDERVTVILIPSLGKLAAAINETSLISYGVRIEARSRHLIRASIPVSVLEEVAEKVSGISYIRLPCKPLPLTVISEGVSLTGASDYHGAGVEGQNVKVGVIDLGFIGLAAAQAAGELPPTVITKDYTGAGIESGTVHGTGVAEIVYDMAPQAQLYLINIGDEVDLENAADYSAANNIRIINHSVGWVNTGWGGGDGLINKIADDARANGILWVNAAGNAAKRHYQDDFSDPDSDDWHNFAPGDETNHIQLTSWSSIYVFLTWNSWPFTDQDYDLYLYDNDLNLVAWSENWQTGTQEPTEAIYYLAAPGTYHIAVWKFSATGAQKLKIFTFYQDLEYQTAAHSLMAPADAIGVMTVAAIDQAKWIVGPQEDFSSQGSTNDGRIKPDISGPDRTSGFTYGTTGFAGTSASSPHVAGAAALVLSSRPSLTANEIQSNLENWAIDMGAAGKDNVYGAGRLYLSLLIAETLEDLIVYPNPFDPAQGHTKVTFEALTEEVTIRIFTLSGELVREVELPFQYRWNWDLRNERNEEVARGTYLGVVINVAGEKKIIKIAVIK